MFCVKHDTKSSQMVCLVSNTIQSHLRWYVLRQTPYNVVSDGKFCVKHKNKSSQMVCFAPNNLQHRVTYLWIIMVKWCCRLFGAKHTIWDDLFLCLTQNLPSETTLYGVWRKTYHLRWLCIVFDTRHTIWDDFVSCLTQNMPFCHIRLWEWNSIFHFEPKQFDAQNSHRGIRAKFRKLSTTSKWCRGYKPPQSLVSKIRQSRFWKNNKNTHTHTHTNDISPNIWPPPRQTPDDLVPIV
jgi:hypothetical protein